MMVSNNLKSDTINDKVRMHVNADSVINTDDSKSYKNFKSLVKEHLHQVIEPNQADFIAVLPYR